jgi:hypothetical protein
LRNPSVDRSLLKTLSRHRLGRYLAEAGDDLDLALGLYERNTRLAESLYTPLQCLEICLRNVIDERMTIEYGPNWLDRMCRDTMAWTEHLSRFRLVLEGP